MLRPVYVGGMLLGFALLLAGAASFVAYVGEMMTYEDFYTEEDGAFGSRASMSRAQAARVDATFGWACGLAAVGAALVVVGGRRLNVDWWSTGGRPDGGGGAAPTRDT